MIWANFLKLLPTLCSMLSPGLAFQFSHLPNKGVGLAREEFIINNYIEYIHLRWWITVPWWCRSSKEIEHKITGYPDEETFFIEKLASGVAKIAASFYPNKTIVRFSDFKSNEYYNL
jgi:pyruvate,water dikinase